ncbi:MAG: hypothetical protein ACLUI0_11915 [Blautia massiliensis (ex Durand et al. 2017)]
MSSMRKLSGQRESVFQCMNGLVELAGMYGFSGNIWHTYLTFLLVNHENAFSMASEIRGAIKGSINDLAKNDFRIFKGVVRFPTSLFLIKYLEPHAAEVIWRLSDYRMRQQQALQYKDP